MRDENVARKHPKFLKKNEMRELVSPDIKIKATVWHWHNIR